MYYFLYEKATGPQEDSEMQQFLQIAVQLGWHLQHLLEMYLPQVTGSWHSLADYVNELLYH